MPLSRELRRNAILTALEAGTRTISQLVDGLRYHPRVADFALAPRSNEGGQITRDLTVLLQRGQVQKTGGGQGVPTRWSLSITRP